MNLNWVLSLFASALGPLRADGGGPRRAIAPHRSGEIVADTVPGKYGSGQIVTDTAPGKYGSESGGKYGSG